MSIGVHKAHCCAQHGCKYGEDDTCPVVLCQVEQDYLCEDCEQDQLRLDSAMKKAVELGLIEDNQDNRKALFQTIKAYETAHLS